MENNINLIPIINPSIKKSGIEAMLEYRINDYIEVDSSQLVRESFNVYISDNDYSCSDTILNALNPLKSFAIFRLKKLSRNTKKIYPFAINEQGNWHLRTDLLIIISDNLNQIFDGYSDLKILFDSFSDKMYCFANLMPVPKEYNLLKGDYNKSNDYPYFFYENLCKKIIDNENIFSWINDNFDDMYIRKIFELEPPFEKPNSYYDYENYEKLKNYIIQAIELIEDRAKWLNTKLSNQ